MNHPTDMPARTPVFGASTLRALCLALLFALGVGAAQDEGLYGGVAQEAAFVRVVHAAGALEAVPATLGERDLGAIAYRDVTPYHPFEAGTYALQAGEFAAELALELFSYYTVVLGPEGVLVLEDAPLTDPARALLALYNLSDHAAIDLKTADGETDVIAGVTSGTTQSVEVNAVEIALAVFADDEALATWDDLGLMRGEAYSAFLFPDGAAWVQAEIAP